MFKRLLIKIKDFFVYDIKYGIRNLIRWFPIIWYDRNWDHYFIYRMLRYKLYLMEKHIRTFGHHVDHIRDANKIRTCMLLLDRLIDDIHHDMAFKRYHEKWGRPDMHFVDSESCPGFKRVEFTHENVKTEEDERLREKEYRFYLDAEDALKKQDLDMLFKLMRKHIESWWD